MERIKTGAYINNIKMENVDMLMNDDDFDHILTDKCFRELKKHLGLNSLDNINYNIIEKEKLFAQTHENYVNNEACIRLTILFEINN